MSRWVWVIGVTLLIVCLHRAYNQRDPDCVTQIIAGAIGLGWYVSHNSTTHNAPTAIGGSANEKAIDAQTSTTAVAEAMATSTVLHVSPTNTVARRDGEPIPTPLAIYPLTARGSSPHRVHVVQTHRHGRRTHLNRTTH